MYNIWKGLAFFDEYQENSLIQGLTLIFPYLPFSITCLCNCLSNSGTGCLKRHYLMIYLIFYKKSDKSSNNVSSNSLFLSSTNSCTSTWSRTAGKGKSVLNLESSCFPGIRQKMQDPSIYYTLYDYICKVSKYFFRCHLCGINISSARTKHCSVCNKWEDIRIVKILG